jgi:hypothetical protein
MLADPRIDPAAAEDNIAIKLVSENGHASVAKFLLADLRLNPAAGGNLAITYASQEGHVVEGQRQYID